MRRLLQIALALTVLASLSAVVGASAFYVVVLRDLPEIATLSDYHPNLITRIYAADGSEISAFSRERRIVVGIEQIPSAMVQAFISAEDDAFYEHKGLDYPGILRAALANLRSGRVKQGGSTITQQVAKTFLLSSERSIARKLKDMVLAMRIEDDLEKNEILFLYLNQIYLGSGAYGVQAAAHTYFGKDVGDLTLSEASMIAGLVPAPSRYTPFNRPDLARSRQRFVLRRMLEKKYISLEQHDAALAAELVLVERKASKDAAAVAYFAESVRRYLVERYGEDRMLTGGLSVRTTLDLPAQRAAYAAVRTGLRNHDRRSGYRGPIRVVPEEDWLRVAEDLETRFGGTEERTGDVVEGLVVEVDDKNDVLRLALGLSRETTLTLDDVKWARTPDPKWDGAIPRIRRVGQALRVGYVVRLERTGTVEPSAEQIAADASAQPVARYTLFQAPLAQGALIAMNVATGHVEAMIGGYSFRESQFNRSTQMKRQPGSAFKPIVYAAALTRGYTPATIIYDTPIVSDEADFTWKPKNYSKEFYGPITLREALAKSRNIATIKIVQDIGLPPILKLAEALGIGANLQPNLGIALGVSEVTLAELVRAYGVFASGGGIVEPVFVLDVTDRDGVVLESNVQLPLGDMTDVASAESAKPEAASSVPDADLENPILHPEELLAELRSRFDRKDDPEALPEGYPLHPVAAYLVTDLLRAVVQEGTGFRVRALKRPMAGKTGTTNDLHDAWFLGYSPQVVAGVWVGFDNAHNLGKNETGSRAASPIFVDFMRLALERYAREEFPIPKGVQFVQIDRKSGLRASGGDPKATVFQPFRAGTAPLEFAATSNANGLPALPLRLD